MSHLQLEISDQLAAAVQRRAEARGISPSRYLADLIRRDVTSFELDPANDRKAVRRHGISGVLRHLAPAQPVSTAEMRRVIESSAAKRFEQSTRE